MDDADIRKLALEDAQAKHDSDLRTLAEKHAHQWLQAEIVGFAGLLHPSEVVNAILCFHRDAMGLEKPTPAAPPPTETISVPFEKSTLCICGAGTERLSGWHDDPKGWTCRTCKGFVHYDEIAPAAADHLYNTGRAKNGGRS